MKVPKNIEDVENMSSEEAAMTVQDLIKMSERVLLTRYVMGEREFVAHLGSNVADGEIELKVTMEIVKGADIVAATEAQARQETDELFGKKKGYKL